MDTVSSMPRWESKISQGERYAQAKLGLDELPNKNEAIYICIQACTTSYMMTMNHRVVYKR